MMMIANALTLLTLLAAGPSDTTQAASRLYRAPAVNDTVDGVVWAAGNWTPWLAAGAKGDSWGNHRAVVRLGGAGGDAVAVTIPWRRHDAHPETKAVVVLDAATGEPVNSLVHRISNAEGEIVFEPRAGSDTYHVYYMPWRSTGGYYPQVTYPAVMHQSDAAWTARTAARAFASLPEARVTRIESVNAFHSFFPMEVIATPEETARFLDAAGGWAVVAEHRDYPVRMRTFIPQHWVHRSVPAVLESKVLRGESFTFQVAVVAGSGDRDSLAVRFEGFPAGVAAAMTCYNCGGIDEKGQPFSKTVSVPAGTVQPLWIGWIVPKDQPVGTVTGRVVVTPRGQAPRSVQVRLQVLADPAVNHGYDEPELMTRLPWLNSTLGSDPNAIIAPFTPVQVNGHRLDILGRQITLGANGLPTQIESFFTPTVEAADGPPSPILAAPIDLEVVTGGQAEQIPARAPYRVVRDGRGAVHWAVDRQSDAVAMRVEGRLEYDGMLSYRIRVTARRDLGVDDIRLPVSYRPDAATWMLGLGREGGLRPDSLDWSWDVTRHQEGLWLGGRSKGLQYVLRDDDYLRPLNTNFYQNQPLRMPKGWFNDGKGGIRIRSSDDAVRAINLFRRADAGGGRHAGVQRALPDHPVQADRHPAALPDPVRAPIRAGGQRQGARRHGGQHPSCQRHQSLHQLSLLQPRRAEGVHRGGARQGDQGQAVRHHP